MSLQQKNIVLLIGMILLTWISYQLSFSKTFALKKQYSELKIEKELFTNVSQKLLQLKLKDVYYDSILKSKKIATESSFQNNLLQTITSYADSTQLEIVNFNTPHIFNKGNTNINTFVFKLNGNFSKITRLLYELEQHYKLGKIVSVHFEKKKNFRLNRYFLECTVLLQRIDSK